MADDGQAHGGWVLRRADGALVDPSRSLGVQDVRDGEILHLVAKQAEWPEMDYDDVVDAIATGARKQSRAWSGAATRLAGIAVTCLTLLVGLLLIMLSGPSWTMPGAVALVLAVVLLVAAVVLSRAMSDAAAGTPIGVVAMLYAFGGGLVILGGENPFNALGSSEYLVASASLLLLSFLAYVGVANQTQFFVAGMLIGLMGIIASVLTRASYIGPFDSAAIIVTVVIAFTPIYPILAIRLGKLPVPALPTSTEDLLADPPQVPLDRVHATVRRSDEILTGLLLGSSVVLVVAQFALVKSALTSAIILTLVVASASLLRARLFPAARHRIPLLFSGLGGMTAVALGSLAASDTFRISVMVPILVVVAGLVLTAGIYFQRRQPTPYFGRIADILDVLLVIAIVPVMCIVVGLYGYLRGLYG